MPLHIVPSPIEQQHIHEALDAAQTAIGAINTIAVVAGLAITFVALAVGLIALWGYNAIKRSACERAERIANNHLKSYIKNDSFKDLMQVKIEKAIEARWQSTMVVRLTEEPKVPGGTAPFPTGVAK